MARELRPSQVPGLSPLYIDGKRDAARRYVTADGEIVARRQYQKAIHGGLSNESFAKLSTQQKQAARSIPAQRLPPRVTQTIPQVIPQRQPTQATPPPPFVAETVSGGVSSPVDTLRAITADIHAGKLTKQAAYKAIKQWFDDYGEDYPDLDYSDIYGMSGAS